MGDKLNLIGQKFGRLTVLEKTQSDKWRGSCWICQCDCGKIISTRGSSLKSGHTKSCGCLHKDIIRQINLKHGHAINGHTTKIYGVWLSMLDRCNNPNRPEFKYYGGRGIVVCERWSKFENFLADMGIAPKGLTLDRIDNNGNYEPNNCRWATCRQQRRNSRHCKLNPLKVQVIKKLLKESKLVQKDIADIFGVVPMTISNINTEETWSDIRYTEVIK